MRIARVAEGVCTAAFAAIFLLFIYAVFTRYVLARPQAWPDELNLVLLVWTTFIAEALVLSDREQVRFDAVYDLAGPTARRVLGIVAALALIVAFGASLPAIVGYVQFLWRKRTAVLNLRLDFVFSCFAIFWVAVIVRAMASLVVLLGPRWRAHVATSADTASTIL